MSVKEIYTIPRFADDVAVSLGSGADSKISFNGTDTYWDLQATGTGGLTIALADSPPAPDNHTVHIWAADAGQTAESANSLLVLENSGQAHISLLTGTSSAGGMWIGTSVAARRAGLVYSWDVNDEWSFLVATGTRLTLSTNELEFQQESTISTTGGSLILEPTTAVVFNSISAGVTANTNSAQGDNPITKMITQVSVCASAGDAVTLPTAVAGAVIIVLNDGAEAADVFPASGDRINEASANIAYSLAVDKNALFVAHDATHWSVILTA